MKAAVLEKLGLENLAILEVPRPEAGPGEVLVRLRAASLNFRDLVVAGGGYGSRQKREGLIPLSDAAGEIVEVGAGVAGWRVGDRVVTCFFPDWDGGPPSERRHANNLGGAVDGVAAEYRRFRADAVFRIPDHLDFREAATLPCAALTAWNAVIELGGVGPGRSVLTQGTGGVSLFAVQFAAMAGAEVIATTSGPAKAELLGRLGARDVVNYREQPEWGQAVRKLAGGTGVDLVVEIGGGDTLKQSMRAVRFGGTIAIIGVVAGAALELNLGLIIMNNLRFQGLAVGSREQYARMLAAIARHKLRPVLDASTFALADLRAALEHLKAGRHVGKVCVDI